MLKMVNRDVSHLLLFYCYPSLTSSPNLLPRPRNHSRVLPTKQLRHGGMRKRRRRRRRGCSRGLSLSLLMTPKILKVLLQHLMVMTLMLSRLE